MSEEQDMTPQEKEVLEEFRRRAAKAFYEALKAEYHGQAVRVSFDFPQPLRLPLLMTPGGVLKDVEPRTIDVRKLFADMMPGLWGYADAKIGSRKDEACLRCGKIFDMNERREAVDD